MKGKLPRNSLLLTLTPYVDDMDLIRVGERIHRLHLRSHMITNYLLILAKRLSIGYKEKEVPSQRSCENGITSELAAISFLEAFHSRYRCNNRKNSLCSVSAPATESVQLREHFILINTSHVHVVVVHNGRQLNNYSLLLISVSPILQFYRLNAESLTFSACSDINGQPRSPLDLIVPQVHMPSSSSRS
ncbi:hypothetical protein T05_5291 [Trichinella murrelli]|uniref:Uncharacterized protein n=1 Tax=Trichinella murrelli TaxID=144512 RepID=A0A0V0T9T9_9BILA|nr:hypothetical protein T05_5291 [Trichinella murrelli]